MLEFAARFFGGALIANALPHLIAGVLGKPLPTPFASPPFRGLSSPRANVLWALANLALAYWFLIHLAPVDVRRMQSAGIVFLGFGAWALLCSRSFERARG